MNCVKKYYISTILLALGILTFQLNATAQSVLSPQERKVIKEFEKQANDYIKLRGRVEKRIPKLSKEATAQEIENYKISFQKSVQAARRNARQGDIFIPAAQQLIRKIIGESFRGNDRLELRETVFEAETAGVPLKVNLPYPDSKEKVEMPPKLLLRLPQLPRQLRYRFVGRNFLLVDRDNGLILDYMMNALP